METNRLSSSSSLITNNNSTTTTTTTTTNEIEKEKDCSVSQETKQQVALVGLVGFAGSGKTTVANILQDTFGYTLEAFARRLKDAVSIIFGWERKLLENDTPEARAFCATPDPWWTNRLSIPLPTTTTTTSATSTTTSTAVTAVTAAAITEITPRWILQHVGCGMRDTIHQDIFIAAVQHALSKDMQTTAKQNCRVCISDVRFPNEAEMIRNHGGIVIRIQRHPDPEWIQQAKTIDLTDKDAVVKASEIFGHHVSEWAWTQIPDIDRFVVENNSTIDDLVSKISLFISL
jgi:hypothetical protein